MQRGEIDASTYPVLTTDQYQTLVDDPRFNVLSVQGSVLRGFMFNSRVTDLRDPRIGHAFLHALDRRALIRDYWGGQGTPINTPFQNPDYMDAEWDTRYQYDPQKAIQLLQDAGWDSNQVVVNKTYYIDHDDYFTAVQQMLAAVGFQMQTLEMSGPAWVNIYYEEPHDFDLVFAGGAAWESSPTAGSTSSFY